MKPINPGAHCVGCLEFRQNGDKPTCHRWSVILNRVVHFGKEKDGTLKNSAPACKLYGPRIAIVPTEMTQ